MLNLFKHCSRLTQQTNSRGFTLVEMLTVIAIIAILAGILTPSLNRARERAYVASCMSNMKELGNLINIYEMDHQAYPTSLDDLDVDAAIKVCPRSKNAYTYTAPSSSSTATAMVTHNSNDVGVHDNISIVLYSDYAVKKTVVEAATEENSEVTS